MHSCRFGSVKDEPFCWSRASHLDADGDAIACEWSWRNWFR
ncbi:excalibur calcium-binding domain-containing protein [Microvirga sp. BT689]|nr:excalibur calcium-binding domain-containing protein [Microvirga arvi]